MQELQNLQNQVNKIHNIGYNIPDNMDDVNDYERTAILGGLTGFGDKNEVWRWLSNELWWYNGPNVTEMYCKGEFKNIVFAKFATKRDRDNAIAIFRQNKDSE